MTRVRSIVASVLAVGFLSTGITALSVSTASAVDCWAEMPQPTKGRWTWRMVDGRKCWYVGDPKLSRSELHWPDASPKEASSASKESDAMAQASDADVAAAAAQNPPAAVDILKPLLDAPATFKARWEGFLEKIR